jgi:hypothetical protein
VFVAVRRASTAAQDGGSFPASVIHRARSAQGWMGHRDYMTTEIYADFAPDPTQGAIWAQRAFG